MEGFKVGTVVLLGRVSAPHEDGGLAWQAVAKDFEHKLNAEALLQEKGIPGEEYYILEVTAGPVRVVETKVKSLEWGKGS